MTNIIVNVKNIEKKNISIELAQLGKWYRIIEYKPNEQLVGDFGVLVNSMGEDCSKMLVSPKGWTYSHSAIVLEEISQVEVICS